MRAEPSNTQLRKEIETVWPRLTREYGLSPNQIAAMPRWLRRVYIEAIPRILAEEQLAAIEVALFPHMKKEDQRSMHRKISRMARVEREEPAAPKSMEEMQALAAMAGIGVEVVPKDEE